jgi:hypothetical protein
MPDFHDIRLSLQEVYFISNPGNHMLKDGSIVINTKVMALAKRKGIAALNILPIPTIRKNSANGRGMSPKGCGLVKTDKQVSRLYHLWLPTLDNIVLTVVACQIL